MRSVHAVRHRQARRPRSTWDPADDERARGGERAPLDPLATQAAATGQPVRLLDVTADSGKRLESPAKGVELIAVPGDFLEESGERAVRDLLDAGTSFDAIFAANDNMAIGALSALRHAGISVPGEVAVAGFDDIPLAKHLDLTTVRVRIAELGEHALERLLAILGGRDGGGDELHAPELVVRGSTDRGADSG